MSTSSKSFVVMLKWEDKDISSVDKMNSGSKHHMRSNKRSLKGKPALVLLLLQMLQVLTLQTISEATSTRPALNALLLRFPSLTNVPC